MRTVQANEKQSGMAVSTRTRVRHMYDTREALCTLVQYEYSTLYSIRHCRRGVPEDAVERSRTRAQAQSRRARARAAGCCGPLARPSPRPLRPASACTPCRGAARAGEAAGGACSPRRAVGSSRSCSPPPRWRAPRRRAVCWAWNWFREHIAMH